MIGRRPRELLDLKKKWRYVHVYVGLSLSSHLYWTYLFSQTSVDYTTTVEDYLARLVEILGWICRRGCCWRGAPPLQPAAPPPAVVGRQRRRRRITGGDAGAEAGPSTRRPRSGRVCAVCVCVCMCVHARVYTAGCGH